MVNGNYEFRAIAVDSTYVEAHNNLSAVLLYLGRVDEALDEARRALELQPEFPAAHYVIARVIAQRLAEVVLENACV